MSAPYEDSGMAEPNSHDPGEQSGSPAATSSAAQPHFVSLKLKGVGGWLMFFVIGQLVLRPLQYFGNPDTTVVSAETAARFPVNTRIIVIERALRIASVIAGMVVALALLKTGNKWPVVLAKVYLVAIPLLMTVLAILYFSSDLPEKWRTQLIAYGVTTAAATSLVGLAWFLYFTKSKRVHATYLGEIN